MRTDVRVCNLSYADTDWYMDQMLRPAYDSPALPLGWSRGDYALGNNDYVLSAQLLSQRQRARRASGINAHDRGSDWHPRHEQYR